MKRRHFLQTASLTGVSLAVGQGVLGCKTDEESASAKKQTKLDDLDTDPKGLALCTWNYVEANAVAGRELTKGAKALEAAIAGVAVEERNIKNSTVGIGGTPDRDGRVTLDACVMNSDGQCGSVVCVENITHVAALAQKVMTETPHVILAGRGAEEFAYSQGFEREELLTDETRQAWKEWKKTSQYKPVINIENHDTIGMLCMDQQGDLAGVCSTSGLAYKIAGRVGDSPIIGSGLYVDNEVGAAVATGLGEEVLKSVGSFLIVELMRNGLTPQAACEEAIRRIVRKNDKHKDFQVAFIAVNKSGEIGSYSIHPGFSAMVFRDGRNEEHRSSSLLTE